MKAAVLLALFAVCSAEYPAALPEIAAPSDSYGPPPEVPSDSYGPPPAAPSDSYGPPLSKAAPVKINPAPLPPAPLPPAPLPPAPLPPAPLPEIKPAPAPETIIAEAVAAAPAQSASFNFLSELAGPSVVAVGVAENNVKNAAVVEQPAATVPAQEEFQLNVPGLIPPITSIPLPPIVPPVQVLPPTVFPPAQAPVPVPVPVQPAPVQPIPVQPIPVQPVPVQPVPVQPVPVQPVPLTVQPVQLEAKPAATAQVTEFTTQIQQAPLTRAQTFVPQNFHHYLLSTAAPIHYAPFFFHSNSLPTSLLSKLLPQVESTPQVLPELLNVQTHATNLLESSSSSSSSASASAVINSAPSTSYGTPVLPAINKK